MKKQNILLALLMGLSITFLVLVSILLIKGLNFSSSEKTFKIEQYGLEVQAVEAYSGDYIEDGEDGAVINVMMATIHNTSSLPIQYCEVVLLDENGKEARFALSTLPANETVTVLEQNQRNYDKNTKFVSASAEYVAYFQTPMSMMEDTFSITGQDGVFNVKNISDKDVRGDIYVYYKNYTDNMFRGGITYRAKIENGLKSGETKQVMTSHFSLDKSMLMFVSINEE